jgi:hypothetical protein
MLCQGEGVMCILLLSPASYLICLCAVYCQHIASKKLLDKVMPHMPHMHQ